MSRTLSSCHGCRVSILNAFASLADISIPSRSLRPFAQYTKPHTRQFSRDAIVRNEPTESHPSPSPPQISQDKSTEASSSEPPAPDELQSDSSLSIPWYLQVPAPETPSTTTSITAHPFQQPLPSLPSSPPPLLSPILNHLSTKIGLDNLSLLDLRSLHPPPALGSNLIMLLGTARSVKHLNTSADRFCRWLRSDYGLRPYADGLLGRQELKVKLRRAAKRARLRASVGNIVAMEADKDDGITTGWICVNVGEVPAESAADGIKDQSGDVVVQQQSTDTTKQAQQDQEEEEQEEGQEEEYYTNPPSAQNQNVSEYTGFGSITTNPRIVVQMFTEEKRAEMDLEGLWDARNLRRMRKEARLDERIQINETEEMEMEELEQDIGDEERPVLRN